MQNLMDFFSKISIVTKSKIRYEGYFHQINQQDQTVTLKNVVSFGTEGRRPNNEIQPSSVVYEYIVFRSPDIEDIQAQGHRQQFVLGVPQATPNVSGAAQVIPNVPPTATPPPAVALNVPVPNQQVQQQAQQAPVQASSQIAPSVVPQPQIQQQQQQQQPIVQQQQSGVPKSDSLDFEEMNKQFQRVTLKDGDAEKKQYKKDNFFDEISTSKDDKKFETREERQAQQTIDGETFGADYVRQNQYQHYFYKKQNNYHHQNNNNYYNNNVGNRRGGYNNNRRRGNGRSYNNNNDDGGDGDRGYQNNYRRNYNNNNNNGGNNSNTYQSQRNDDYQQSGGGGGGGYRGQRRSGNDRNYDDYDGGRQQQRRNGNRRGNDDRPYTSGYNNRQSRPQHVYEKVSQEDN